MAIRHPNPVTGAGRRSPGIADSDLAPYVTGAPMVADGGLTAQTGLASRIPLPKT